MDYKKLADLLFPNLKYTVENIEKMYPPRNLPDGAEVTRFAPSPTGYMHIGHFFPMLISYRLAKSTNGIFYLRNEDTDAKREVAEAVDVIFSILNAFNIHIDEYEYHGKIIGKYGPYKQSSRKDIYKAYAKKLVAEGKAFPCFCEKTEGKQDVLKLREEKFSGNATSEEYDPCRNLSFEEIKKNIDAGKKFAIRLKTNGKDGDRIKFYDVQKGEIEMQANAKDVVLLKNDGIPPYTFAHPIDDHLMGTTFVVRGEEWLPQTPVHIEIFEALGFPKIRYFHNPVICKFNEDGGKRKLSKRLDPEADMRFFLREGYPVNAVEEYILNLISSSFEPWRNANPEISMEEFKFKPNEITANMPIFDMVKLNDVSKSLISRMNAKEVYDNVLDWAKDNDKEFAKFLEENKEYSTKVFNIDRESPKPRKDIYKWSMIKDYFLYMFESPKLEELLEEDKEKYFEFIKEYAKSFKFPENKEEWFSDVKIVAEKLGYAIDNKLYKSNPEKYKGNTAKACEFVRLALTGRRNSPDLYEIITILGEGETKKRLH